MAWLSPCWLHIICALRIEGNVQTVKEQVIATKAADLLNLAEGKVSGKQSNNREEINVRCPLLYFS